MLAPLGLRQAAPALSLSVAATIPTAVASCPRKATSPATFHPRPLDLWCRSLGVCMGAAQLGYATMPPLPPLRHRPLPTALEGLQGGCRWPWMTGDAFPLLKAAAAASQVSEGLDTRALVGCC